VIEQAFEATDELVAAMERLVPQLTATRRAPTQDELAELVRTQTLLIARVDGEIVGTLTLVLFRTIALRAQIEDVIVDEAARGRGIGEALTREAIRRAREAGAVTLALTSHPSREAANRLYRRLGFQQRETNVYRMEL
jgi:ribosomal protein S18 acetylase RimI-like enzyme